MTNDNELQRLSTQRAVEGVVVKAVADSLLDAAKVADLEKLRWGTTGQKAFEWMADNLRRRASLSRLSKEKGVPLVERLDAEVAHYRNGRRADLARLMLLIEEASAALSCLSTPEPEREKGERMVLVPREPTEAMLLAGDAAEVAIDWDRTTNASSIYRAMIAAASPIPAPEKGAKDGPSS